MATRWGLTCLFIGLNILQICNAHPMEQLLSGSEGPNGQVMGVLVAVMVSVCVVFVLLACVCCKRRSGFKENENEKKVFRNSPVTASVINETSLTGDDPGHVNPIASAEFTIFTPLSPPHHNNNVFRSQPPVICYTENEAAPELNKAVNPQIDGIDVSEWFADTEYDFPRSRLKYTRELGTGWFGRVVEGEAHGIDSSTENPTWTPVAVRILESSASAHEQAQFLHEASVYRAGVHPNLLRLLGRSLEATPLLLIQELCSKGNLKKFLIENRECKDSDVMAGVPLRFCCQLASAVEFLHDHSLPHLDLAARTCQISSDLNLKLGEYGLAVSQYSNDYYQGTPSIPVRWCAPESVNHTNTTLQPKQITLESNIWSLAVTFWEICEWGRLPYDWLSDDEVVSQVMDTPHTRLPQPTLNAHYIPPLYRLMEYCWLPDQNRPKINQIYSMLVHLSKTYTSSPSTQPETNDFSTENFDLRWESFKPNTIIKTDNAKTKSASLTNLHGSFENLADGVSDTVIQMDSWLENVASHTGDMQYVRGLSEAIHELDIALASEQTSSSSSFEATPNSSLGPARSDTIIHMDDSSNLDSLILLPKRSESGSETEDETWRKRIERGALSEKVKQKSKSVADLMVLTHIDMNTVKDIFQEELKKLQEERRESLLFVPVHSSDPDHLQDVNIMQDAHDRMVKSSFGLMSSANFMDPLRSLEPKESLIHADKSLTELEVSINAVPHSSKDESLNEESSFQKVENNLLKSSSDNTKEKSRLVVEPQIITDNKTHSKTVSSESDSKLEEKLISEPDIKLVESNQIESTFNKNTNEETSCNFDTFLQQDPLTNKIGTIESKETVILNPESGHKILEVIDNFNQNMLSNEILVKEDDEPQNTTLVSTTQKGVDNVEKHSQEEISPHLEHSSESLEENHHKIEHIEPISIKTDEFSLVQDFINNERKVILTLPNKIEEKKKVSLEEDIIRKTDKLELKDSAIIMLKTQEISANKTDLEYENEKIQPKEEIENIIDCNVKEVKSEEISGTSQITELLEENKNPTLIEKSEADTKLTEVKKVIEDIVKNKTQIIKSEDVLIKPQVSDLLKKNKELIVIEKSESDLKQEIKSEEMLSMAQITEVLEENKEPTVTDKCNTNIESSNEILQPKATEIISSPFKIYMQNKDLNLNIKGSSSEDDEILEESKIDIQLNENKINNNLLIELSSTSSSSVENTTKNNNLDDLLKVNEDTINKMTEDFIIAEIINISSQIEEPSPGKLDLSTDLQHKIEKKEEVANTLVEDKETKEPIIIPPFIPEIPEKKELRTEQVHDNVTKVEEITTTNIPEIKERIEENLLQKEELVNTSPQPLFVENKTELFNNELHQIEDNSKLIDVSLPSEFVEQQKENKQVQKNEETTALETSSILIQLEESPVEKKATNVTEKEVINNSPQIEEFGKELDLVTTKITANEFQLVEPTIELETKENLNKDETENVIINKLDIKEQILCTTDLEIPETIFFPEKITPEKITITNEKNVRDQELSNVHSEKKLIDNLIQDSPIISTQEEITKQLDPIMTAKRDEFSLIQNFITNERNNKHHDLISSEVEVSPKEESNSKLLPVPFDLTSELLEPPNVQQIMTVKRDEFPLIQNFINNERNNNHHNLISSDVEVSPKEESNSNLPPVPSDLTSELLEPSNVQQINQVFNVFSVTVDHKPPLECFTSPVKNFYARPFDQNELITDINSLLESECKKYESKNLVCTSSLQNDFLPFVNGISSELSNKIIDILNEKEDQFDNGEHVPKKFAEIALDTLKNNVEHSETNECEDNIANGHEEIKELNNTIEFCEKEPKKLSEIVLDSLKTNSVSEDSGFGSVHCEDKIINCVKDSDDNSVDILKISEDNVEDILSITEENVEDKIENEILIKVKQIAEDAVNSISEEASKKISAIMLENLKNNSVQPTKNIELNNSQALVASFGEDVREEKMKNNEPKKLSEIVQGSLNKTYVKNELNDKNITQNLPDIILDNLQNKTFVKDQNIDINFEKTKDEILINVLNDSPIKSFNSLGEENSESAIEDILCTKTDKNTLNITADSPRKLSEIILDSLPCNSPLTSESTDNVSDKTVIEVKTSDNSSENNQICDEVTEKLEGDNLELSSPNFLSTSTPFKLNLMPKKTEINNDSFFSFVSEGDEPSDCQTRVILGPCEEYGLGLYSGLKTTFGKFSDDDRPEEELLQFSSNFMPYSESDTTHNSVDYSLETWDKFLGKSLQDQDNCSNSVFDNFSPKHDSVDVFNCKNKKGTEIKNEELDKTVTLTNNKNNETFTIEHETPVADTNMKEDEPDQVETTQNSWEPGEGWFLHPQSGADDLTGQIDISGGDAVDNSYVGFALDEECVNALRNELAAKLPHAQGISHEEPQEPEEWDTEERNEIIVKYNVYATPLSPIPEESCCDDVYCDQIQHRYLDGSDSESEWSEPCLGQTSQLEEDILVVDTETHTALILESPSLREPQHRHTPSQDSCCSNDTLFNLEDLNYGHSPQHHGLAASAQPVEPDSDQIFEIEITENENETPKQSPQIPKIETEENVNSDSTEMNLTYTKPDINIDESENSNYKTVLQDSQSETGSKPDDSSKSLNKLELKLDPNAFGVAPLPSPEDIPWRQLPASLLTYNEVVQNDKFEIQDSEDGPTDTIENVIDQDDLNLAQECANDDLSDSVRDCTLDQDLYSNLTDIRFSGPCDAQLMSTSFSESADYAEERDWDSGSDTRSSSSGEFIWKEGEHEESLRALHAASHDVGVTEDINPMDAIEEENSNSSEDSDDCEEDMEETEFVPSAWDAQATPTKSALRSPEKSTKRKNQQKGVWFKKQKYHCVYEYPREPESPVAPPSDLWRPLSDFSTFADWELDPESCVQPTFEDTTDGGYDVLDKFITRSTYPLASGSARHRDLYQLNPFPDFGAGLSSSDEDFFISSSAHPFQAVGQSSQFFPGQTPSKSKFLWQDYQSSSQQSSRDLSDGITPDSGIDDVTPAGMSESGLVDILPSRSQKVPPLKCLAAIAANKPSHSEQKNVDSSLGGLRHTRNRLKLDLPPSPNSFSSTRTFAIDVACNDPVTNREIPAFTTFGKTRFSVQHVATPTDECSDPLQSGKAKTKNVSFEALPHKPMKLTEKVYILDKAEDEGKHKPVEMVQGEASLLDSADEDSGIESSANATLERHQHQILN